MQGTTIINSCHGSQGWGSRKKAMVLEPNAAAMPKQIEVPMELGGLGVVAGALLQEY